MEYITLEAGKQLVFRIEGYEFNRLTKVFLSAGEAFLLPSTTAVNMFSNMRRISAICPPFSGYEYPQSDYTVTSDNVLILNLPGYDVPADIDVIFFNSAGYSKLSDRDIQFTTAPGTWMLTEDNKFYTTENGDYIIEE